MLTTITTAHSQYSRRPQDERFPDLRTYITHAAAEKALCQEKHYNLKDLRVEPIDVGAQGIGPNGQPLADLALVSPKGAAVLTHYSFGQLARTVKAPAAYLRDGVSPQLAADCLNYGIAQSPTGTDVNILARAANGTPYPIVRACTSETYGRAWDAPLYDWADRLVFQGTSTGTGGAWTTPTAWDGKPAGVYGSDRDSFVIQIDGGSIVTDPSAAGQDSQLYRGVMIRNSEVGASAIVIECVLFRYICGNLMLWGATIDRSYRRRHVGTGDKVIRDAVRELQSIATRWVNRSASQDETIIRALIDNEIAESRAAVIDVLAAGGMTKLAAGAAYDRAEATESASPRSFWGIAQGITRISQDSGYQDERYQLDQLAAQVLARGRKLVAA